MDLFFFVGIWGTTNVTTTHLFRASACLPRNLLRHTSPGRSGTDKAPTSTHRRRPLFTHPFATTDRDDAYVARQLGIVARMSVDRSNFPRGKVGGRLSRTMAPLPRCIARYETARFAQARGGVPSPGGLSLSSGHSCKRLPPPHLFVVHAHTTVFCDGK